MVAYSGSWPVLVGVGVLAFGTFPIGMPRDHGCTRPEMAQQVSLGYTIDVIGTRVASTLHVLRAALLRNMVSNPRIEHGFTT